MASFTLQTTAPAAAGSITNYASVDPSGGTNPPTPGTLCAPTDACTSATTQINTPAALSVTKSNGVDQVQTGSETVYLVTLSNTGGTDVSNLQWSDVASGMTVTAIEPRTVGANSAAGACNAGGCSGVKLGAGESIVYAVTATVTAAAKATITNTANLSGGANCVAVGDCFQSGPGHGDGRAIHRRHAGACGLAHHAGPAGAGAADGCMAQRSGAQGALNQRLAVHEHAQFAALERVQASLVVSGAVTTMATLSSGTVVSEAKFTFKSSSHNCACANGWRRSR